jgi:hypothetical protein
MRSRLIASTAIGVAFGLVAGFVMGLIAMIHWNERAQEAASPSTPPVGYVESYFMCKWSVGSREATLIIKGDHSGAKTMTISWFSDARTDVYRVEETTDLFYKAVETNPEASKAVRSWLELNRVSGELSLISRYVSDNTVVSGDTPRAECRNIDRRF